MDYDEVFGRLAADCNLSYRRIRNLTPRQTFDHYFRPRNPETGEALPLETPMPAPAADQSEWFPGMPKGLGLEQYECCRRYPGEDPNDPFSVPREIVEARNEAILTQYWRRGMLKGIEVNTVDGVKKVDVHPRDAEGFRDFLDYARRQNRKRFEQLKTARTNTEAHENGVPQVENQ